MAVPTSVILRDSLPLPSPTAPVAEISFCHPDYDDPHDVLFTLPRLDYCASSSLKGVHYGTALAACQIIANNAFNGYLATDRVARTRVQCAYDDVLTGSRYWFFDNTTNNTATLTSNPSGLLPKLPYPVVPSFQDWAFPHQRYEQDIEYQHDQGNAGEFPTSSWRSRWHQPTGTAPSRCVVTQVSSLIHGAHLIPSAERDWFERNAMARYGTHHDIDQSANKINLRNDVHAAFDDYWFAIVPKVDSYAVHILSATKMSKREFSEQFHNVSVLKQAPVSDAVSDIPAEFLYARFARAVLLLLKPFVAQSAIARRVARYLVREHELGSAPRMYVEWLSSEELHRQYGGGGTRSASPSKRKRGPEQNERYESGESDGSDNDSDETIDSGSKRHFTQSLLMIDTSLDEEDERGRSRKRRCYEQVKNTYGLRSPRSVI
ncbi:hypothetical protein F4803DRAFT_543466 [Xylaria telfairii]|nr:hypothetical protein F4803DRAFT_543466 [Xylaria telfairii]